MIESVKGIGRAFGWLFGQFDTFINKDIPEFLRSIEAFKQGWVAFFDWLKGWIDWLLIKAGLKKGEGEEAPPAGPIPRERQGSPGRAIVRGLPPLKGDTSSTTDEPSTPRPATPAPTTRAPSTSSTTDKPSTPRSPQEQKPTKPKVLSPEEDPDIWPKPEKPKRPKPITPPPPPPLVPPGGKSTGDDIPVPRIRGPSETIQKTPMVVKPGDEKILPNELLRKGRQRLEELLDPREIERRRDLDDPNIWPKLNFNRFNPSDMGSSFGSVAALALVGGLDGVSIPVAGIPSNSRGVAPRSASKETGGDTACDGRRMASDCGVPVYLPASFKGFPFKIE